MSLSCSDCGNFERNVFHNLQKAQNLKEEESLGKYIGRCIGKMTMLHQITFIKIYLYNSEIESIF